MAEKRKIEEKQPAVELGEANDDIILMDANTVPSHQPLPFEEDDMDDIPTKTKKPKVSVFYHMFHFSNLSFRV